MSAERVHCVWTCALCVDLSVWEICCCGVLRLGRQWPERIEKIGIGTAHEHQGRFDDLGFDRRASAAALAQPHRMACTDSLLRGVLSTYATPRLPCNTSPTCIDAHRTLRRVQLRQRRPRTSGCGVTDL